MSIEEIDMNDVMEAEAHVLIELYKNIHDELDFRLEHANDSPPIKLEHEGQIGEIEDLLS